MFYTTRIRPHTKNQWAIDKNQLDEDGKQMSALKSMNRLALKIWKKESPETKKLVEEERDRRYMVAMDAYKKSVASATEPEQLQRSAFRLGFS